MKIPRGAKSIIIRGKTGSEFKEKLDCWLQNEGESGELQIHVFRLIANAAVALIIYSN